MKKNEVETFDQAKKHTLKKWKNVLRKIERLGEDEQCGFCFLSVNIAIDNIDKIKAHNIKCFYCPVEKKCISIQKANMKYLYEYLGEVNNLIRWLNLLNENDVKSRYQLKGGG